MPLRVRLFELLIYKMHHVKFLEGKGGGGFCLSSVKCFLGFPCSKHFENVYCGVCFIYKHSFDPALNSFSISQPNAYIYR